MTRERRPLSEAKAISVGIGAYYQLVTDATLCNRR